MSDSEVGQAQAKQAAEGIIEITGTTGKAELKHRHLRLAWMR